MALIAAQARPHRLGKAKGPLWRQLGLLVLLLSLAAPLAQAKPTREFQVKAAFLYNFAQFVDWPPSAFPAPDTPFVIGVLGMDPFGDFLDELVQGEKINGRPLVVKRFRWIGEVDTCHVLFVSGSEGSRVQQIADELHGRAILTVCDWDGFEQRGAIIRLAMEHNRVRLRINLDAAREAGLNISSKLLRSAETVTQKEG
jgi:hypothetical protein